MFEIPVTNSPNQSFVVSIPLATGNIRLSFRMYWNRYAEYWQADIGNETTDTRLLTGIPLIASNSPAGNLLEPYTYLGIGSAYVLPLDGVGNGPGVDEWGSKYLLLWGD